MLGNRSPIRAAAIMLAMLWLPLSASADYVINVPASPNNQVTFVNVMVINFKVWVSVSNNSGLCQWYNPSSISALQDDLVINGSSGRDYIALARSSGTLYVCGSAYSYSKVNLNLHDALFFGNAGDDNLFGCDIDGGDGNDYLEAYEGYNGGPIGGGGEAFGGNGNDEIRTDQVSVLLGDAGNDKLCAPPNVHVGGIWGGSGSDVFCSSDASANSATKNCGACGF